MSRTEEAKEYFRRQLDDLTDDVFGHVEDAPQLLARSQQIRGALAYAKSAGDVEQAYYRIFSDMLASLDEEIIEYTRWPIGVKRGL